jgi:hypothetical protein
MVVRSFCGMMFGIQMGIYLTSMDTKFSMMLTDPLDLGCPRLLERENGSGLELDLINWCKSKVGCLKLELGGRTFWFGNPPLASIHVPRLGRCFELNC